VGNAWKAWHILVVNGTNIFYVIGWIIAVVVGLFDDIYNYNKTF
jgi:hypothetical protein